MEFVWGSTWRCQYAIATPVQVQIDSLSAYFPFACKLAGGGQMYDEKCSVLGLIVNSSKQVENMLVFQPLTTHAFNGRNNNLS